MRLLYFILNTTLSLGLPLFFREIGTKNKKSLPKKKGTLYVANHPSAFMDPIIVAWLSKQPIHFLTMAEVFKAKKFEGIFRSAHMYPIYRQVDGPGSMDKNEEIFKTCHKLLFNKKGVLIFGESMTDDTFVRRLKPIKKGAARIAFGALEEYGWDDFDLNIVAVGTNYSEPSIFRSDVIINYADPINVADYKELYQENNAKGINALTSEISERIKGGITHIQSYDLEPFFEQLLIISKKGMSHDNFDKKLSLKDRLSFSRNLAKHFNETDFLENNNNIKLKESTQTYFEELDKLEITDNTIKEYIDNGRVKFLDNLFALMIGFPMFFIGFISNYAPWYIIRIIARKSMKRPVFRNAVKIIAGHLIGPIFYIPILFGIHFIFKNGWITFASFAVLLYAGIFAYEYVKVVKVFRKQLRLIKLVKTDKERSEKLCNKRNNIIARINRLTKGPLTEEVIKTSEALINP